MPRNERWTILVAFRRVVKDRIQHDFHAFRAAP